MSEQRITVAVRIRPAIERERYEPLCARKASDDQTITIKPEESAANLGEAASFQFDYVFDGGDDQAAVYDECVQELVDHALSGFNSTVFTYGQTGSGKTFTILGHMSPDGKVSSQSGMFLRVFDDLFTYREAVAGKYAMTIALSALELYVEEVRDLLSDKKKLKLRETPEEMLTVGINTVAVENMSDVVRNFEIANSFRSTSSTKMNDESSRSHALFFIDVFQVPLSRRPDGALPPLSTLLDENGQVVAGAVPGLVRSRIALVDLAGSERVKRSGVTGQGMTEAQAINKSLSTLGTVINAMYTQNSHIPFRENKLTKMLKTSFTDTTSRLLLIGQVAPPQNSASESLGTLRFCDRVKGLKAGKVMGFSDPEAEQRYLNSLRLNEELTAEMRILAAQYYYRPSNVRALAAVQGTTVEQTKAQAQQYWSANSARIAQEKEQEALKALEAQAARERDQEVEAFVLKMNALIEEYETIATAAKKSKKAGKKEREEMEAEQEQQLQAAKKAKKTRIKWEEKVNEMNQEVEVVNSELRNLEKAIERVKLGEDDEGDAPADAGMDPAVEEALMDLVESFYTHATELNRLYGLYVARLSATGRQRAEVRRAKLLSSSIITDTTLVPDILTFITSRAVDIASGVVKAKARWSWADIDGCSQKLLDAEQMWPPLLPVVPEEERLPRACQPCAEKSHTRTFLSSDESDDENSHHAAETRRKSLRAQRQAKKGINGEYDDSDSEDDDDEEEEVGVAGAGAASADPGAAPKTLTSNWTAGELQKDDAAEQAPAPVEPPKRKSKKHKKVEEEEEAEAGAAPAAADDHAESPEAAPAHRSKRKKDKGKGGSEGSPAEEQIRYKNREEESSGDDASDSESGEAGAAAPPGGPHERKGHQNAGAVESAPPPLSKEEQDLLYLQNVYDSPSLIQDLIKFLKTGCVMVKHGRSGKPHRRMFWVSTARSKRELLWMQPDAKSNDRSSVDLEQVTYIQLGCFSKVFKRHPIPPSDPAFYRSFTIGLKGRTVDVVADSLPDYEAWVVGLSHLVGVDPAWGGKLNVSAEMGFDRLNFFESSLCESNYIYPMDYLSLKKAVQKRATRALEILSQCGNDPIKAHAILGGIHPPAINEKGAVYLTKGELRYLMVELQLDIFRVSRIWLLFQSMDLVFDPNFSPATAFGVTQRMVR